MSFVDDAQRWVNKTQSKIERYVKSLPQDQLYAHVAVGLGVVLIIVALVLW